MDLPTLANLAEVFGAMAVLVALVLGWIELRHYQRQRADVAAFELARSIQSPELVRHFRHVLSLPRGITAAGIRERGAEDACLALVVAMEAHGVMVHRRVIPLDVLDDLMGGVIQEVWKRTLPWVEEVRHHQGDTFAEWAQWLVERLEAERPDRRQAPAYEAHRGWRP